MFEGLELEFNGQRGEVTPRRIIELLSILESTSSDPNRVREEEPSTFDMGLNKVTIVYSKILRFAGIEASDLEIGQKLRSDSAFTAQVYAEITAVLTALRPPPEYAPHQDNVKKPKAAKAKKKNRAEL